MDVVLLAGRMFLSVIFLLSAFMKLTHFSAQVAHAESMGVPVAGMAIILAALAELIGGLAILTGFKARAGAWLLFLYMIPTTVIFHTNFADQTQIVHFLKNLAIMGGLLMLAGAGPGQKALGE